MAQAHTWQRRIEEAVVGLVEADADIMATLTKNETEEYAAVVVRAYDRTNEISQLDILVQAKDLANEMLGALGRGAEWRCTLVVQVVVADSSDTDNGNADLIQGACERFVAALTPAAINTALNTASITIAGITAAEEPDQHDEERSALWRTSACVLHFVVA